MDSLPPPKPDFARAPYPRKYFPVGPIIDPHRMVGGEGTHISLYIGRLRLV